MNDEQDLDQRLVEAYMKATRACYASAGEKFRETLAVLKYAPDDINDLLEQCRRPWEEMDWALIDRIRARWKANNRGGL
ncbi:hypothetical protein ACWDTT_33270 [Streptosporangium sandarakinum]